MKNSIIQAEKECFVTGETYNLHKHHIFGGANRKRSEKYGLFIWLRADHHNMESYGIHFNKEFDGQVKAMAQEKAMKEYGWTMEEWILEFGKNYIIN